MNVSSMPPISPLQPQLAENQVLVRTRERLESFRATHCSGIDAESMNFMIEKGDELIGELQVAARDENEWQRLLSDGEKINKQAAIYLMWALTKKTAEQEDLYTEGAIRIGGGAPLTAEKLEQFFLACGGARFQQSSEPIEQRQLTGGDAYFRISTHMHEGMKGGARHRGLDLGDMPPTESRTIALPAEKRTILFARQADGTFYIKMEAHGVPPFWSKKFRSFKNFGEFFGHAADYIMTRKPIAWLKRKALTIFRQDSGEKPILGERKEHVSSNITQTYSRFIRDQGLRVSRNDKKKAMKLGVSTMVASVPLEHQETLRNQLIGVRGPIPLQYEGGVKGHEILLQNLSYS